MKRQLALPTTQKYTKVLSRHNLRFFYQSFDNQNFPNIVSGL
jgi:hypothetical protein